MQISANLPKLMRFKRNIKNGFTIIELIIAGAISITTIGIGFSLLQIALKGNKIDETQMGINGRINDTLDFILDEVKASKRIIAKESDIDIYNTNCTYPEEGEFLFGIRLPDQALAKSDYIPEGDQFNLNQVECPIVYTLRPSKFNEKSPYSLIRYGPQYNSSGYYVSPSYIQFQETLLLDGISASQKYNKINCPNNWSNIKTLKGISFCIDEYKKAIEIQIEAEDTQRGIADNELRSIASVGGFSSIQDESQFNINPFSTYVSNNVPSCFGGKCCWIGVCLKSNKITYIIDNSYYLNENYFHLNGKIINGNWEEILNPALISPRINGKNLFDYVRSSLKQHINKLPNSESLTEDNKVYIQVIANNGSSTYLFEDGPQELSSTNKNAALDYLNNLESDINSSINPWEDLCRILESEYVGQVIILSAWKPENEVVTGSKSCAGYQEGKFSEIISEFNQYNRSKSATGALIIDTISLFNNFCESSKNPFNNSWLGSISKGAESTCIHIK